MGNKKSALNLSFSRNEDPLQNLRITNTKKQTERSKKERIPYVNHDKSLIENNYDDTTLFTNLWKLIFEYIDQSEDLFALSQTNKRFNKILQNNELWKLVVEKYLSEEFILCLNFANQENLFENVWKSFSTMKASSCPSDELEIISKSDISYFSRNSEGYKKYSMKTKDGSEFIILLAKRAENFNLKLFCGFLDKNLLATGKGSMFYFIL